MKKQMTNGIKLNNKRELNSVDKAFDTTIIRAKKAHKRLIAVLSDTCPLIKFAVDEDCSNTTFNILRNHFNALGKTFSIKDIEYTYLNYIFNEVTVFVGDNFSLEDIEQLLFGNRSATIEEDTSLWDDGFESEIDELIVRMNEVDIPEDIQSWSIDETIKEVM